MATKTATIPILDDSTACSSGYMFRYKANYDQSWIILNPAPIISPIVVKGLAASTVIDYELTRYCCDGSVSDVLRGSFTTPA